MAHELDELQAQIDELEKKRKKILAEKRASVIADINEKIRLYDISLKDLAIPGVKPVIKRDLIPAKYTNGSETWSGRGRKPGWVEVHLASGGELEDLLIK